MANLWPTMLCCLARPLLRISIREPRVQRKADIQTTRQLGSLTRALLYRIHFYVSLSHKYLTDWHLVHIKFKKKTLPIEFSCGVEDSCLGLVARSWSEYCAVGWRGGVVQAHCNVPTYWVLLLMYGHRHGGIGGMHTDKSCPQFPSRQKMCEKEEHDVLVLWGKLVDGGKVKWRRRGR